MDKLLPHNKSTFPAVIIILSLVTSFATISIAHLLLGGPLLFVKNMGISGFDYRVFYQASQNIINGQSPYDIPQDIPNNGYVTTPIPAIFNLIFIPFGFSLAKKILYLLIPVSIILGFKALVSIFSFSKTDKDLILTSGFFSLLLGYPFYFLIERANIDGWVFLFLCLGLFFQRPKTEWSSGLFFSLAIFFKIYPILILLPIFLYKKWRLLIWLCLWLLLWGIFSIFWFSDFQSEIINRSQSFFVFDENGSLVATIALISLLFNATGYSNLIVLYSPVITAIMYGCLISLMIFADYKASKNKEFDITSVIMYIPFMVALPQVVYHYSFVILLILIPAICYLWERSSDYLHKILIFIISIGISLSQWQSMALFNLTQNILAQVIPGLGLLIVMFGVVAYKLVKFRPTPRERRPGYARRNRGAKIGNGLGKNISRS
jgi:hypothetical protein